MILSPSPLKLSAEPTPTGTILLTMKLPLLFTCLGLFTFLSGAPAAPMPPVEDRVRDLLARMTLEEKVGQLVQYSSRGALTGPASQTELVPAIKAGGVGSMLNVTGTA